MYSFYIESSMVTEFPFLDSVVYGTGLNVVLSLSVFSCLIRTWSPSSSREFFAPGCYRHKLSFYPFCSASRSLTSWSFRNMVKSGSFPLIFRLKSSSAGLFPVLLWSIALYIAIYLQSSFHSSLSLLPEQSVCVSVWMHASPPCCLPVPTLA